jgi:type III restriction enzyme
VEALQQINPSFILELTATPRDNSNIISYVDAKQLKDEHMVKLPVIVYNSRTKTDVILQSIQLRNSLEAMAIEAERQGGDYIRPIVLFQAQPRTSDDSETFDKIKQSLVAAGIPEEQIKIKTANQNELKGQDLMSRSCPVRYIITVNALKEGWDCPFAYILASLANRSSQVDVEQILGRILRLPYARVSTTDFLNMGYVFTSSADFNNTIQIILRGLQNAGFSARDYRAPQLQPDSTPPTPVTPQEPDLFGPDDEPTSIHESHSDYETPADEIHSDVLHKALQQAQTEAQTPPLVQDILTKAQQGNADYVQQLAAGGATDATNTLPPEAFETGRVGMKSRYAAEGAALRLPVFEMRLECKNPHLFETAGDAAYVPLEKTMLYSGFDLNRCDKNMDFQFTGRDVKQIDLEESGQDEFVPRVWTLNAAAIDRFKQYIQSLPTEGRVHQLAGKIADSLNFDCLTRPVLVRYIMDILSRLQEEELEQLTDNIGETIDLFKAKINGLLAAYAKQEFQKRLDVGKIRMNAEGYKLPQSIVVTNRDKSGVPHALYCEEEAFNGFETRVIQEIAGMPNVAFWHRNQERGKGFYINGFINHYPDFIVQMRNGMVLLIETKGGDRDNSDSQAKLDLGTAWANKAGANYRYYMVFENNETLVGALTLPKLLERLKQLD